MDVTQQQTIEWLINGEAGVSSKTMAAWLAFGIKKKDGSHPRDPADFNRCLQLLAAAPGLRQKLPQIAKMSPKWAVLAAKWPELEACFLKEAGLGWKKARSAPETWRMMRELFES